MNWKNLSIATLFAALSLGAVTAQAQSLESTGTSPSSHYMYGEHLDIAKVLAINEGSASGCGVLKARMTYLDSMGARQVLNYNTIGENCDQDN